MGLSFDNSKAKSPKTAFSINEKKLWFGSERKVLFFLETAVYLVADYIAFSKKTIIRNNNK